MDKKIFKYRKRYKKCKYCKYYTLGGSSWITYDKCIAKNKIIRNINTLKLFCSCYEVKDEL